MSIATTWAAVLVGVAALSGGAAPADAATAWDEAVRGDLSDDRLAPTPVAFAFGENRVLGTTGNAGSGIDRDYFRFTVPAGFELEAIVLLGNTTVSGGYSFVGLMPGEQMTVTPSGAGMTADFLALHYDLSMVDSDLLGTVGRASLPAGTYSVWIQETGGPVAYGLDFVVAAVPEPESALLLLTGLAAVGAYRRRHAE